MVGNDMTTIGEIAVVFDGPHATPKKIDAGPYFLSISSLDNGKLDLSKSAHLSEEQFVKWTKRITPQEGDLLFSYETRLGDAALVPPNIKCCLGRRMGLLRPNREKVLPTYLLYAYLSPGFQSTIDQRKVLGSTVDRIALKDLPNFPIRIPPLPEQKEIAHILGSLDDKIELNRQMNATLEGMAQALFKSWFVDFDPVIDNALAAGNPIPDALAARAQVRRQALADGSVNRDMAADFPAAFQFTDGLGWIPEGWGVTRFKEILHSYIDNRGKTPPLSDFGIPLIEVKHITDDSISPNLNTGKYVDDKTYETWFRKHLEVHDIIISTVGTIGGICMVSEGPKFVIAQNLLGLRFNQTIASPYFMYYQMKGHRFIHDVDARLVITVQASIKRKDLNTIDLLLPSIKVQSAFESVIKSLIQKQTSRQSNSLAKLRDTLLPKLISGELRVPNAEKLAAEAGA